jgi:hypothetical protein
MHHQNILQRIGGALGSALDIATPANVRWHAQRGEIANRIKDTLDAMKEADVSLGGVGSTLYRVPMGIGRMEAGEAAQSKAQSYAQKVSKDFEVGMANVNVKQLLAGSQVELNKVHEILMRAQAKYQQDRIDLGYYSTDANNITRESVANILAQAGIDREHPIALTIQSWLAGHLIPSAAGAPSGETPTRTVPVPERQAPGLGAPPAQQRSRSHRTGGTTDGIAIGQTATHADGSKWQYQGGDAGNLKSWRMVSGPTQQK